MLKSSFNYHLPEELIAKSPAAERTGSRLLVLPRAGELVHTGFKDILGQLSAGDLLVFNNTKVVPARLFARKETGGAVEILIERLLSESEVIAQVRASKSPKPETKIILDDGTELQVQGRDGQFFRLSADESWLAITERLGHTPLPPYIDREDELSDKDRYQTVYAKQPGAVAAPTAGLHFDQLLLDEIQKQGVHFAEVTLHVGAGTYQPVRADNIEDHQMHSEWIQIDQQTCDLINQTRAAGGKVIAVGTTAMRTLESAADSSNRVNPYSGDTDIFIYPGYEFRAVDAMITNFHLPESTLLMLVSAFSGYQRIKEAYEVAVAEQYRFFSYGDAMYLERNPSAVEDIPE